MTYNGYTNYETWAFKLHIGGICYYFLWREQTKKSKNISLLAYDLRAWFDEVFESVIEGQTTAEAKLLIRDCGNGNHINFVEVARALWEEHRSDK